MTPEIRIRETESSEAWETTSDISSVFLH